MTSQSKTPITNVLIDWLAFTIPTTRQETDDAAKAWIASWTDDIIDFMPDIANWVFSVMSDMTNGKGRPPYNTSLNFTGGMIAFSPKQDNILVEFTGKGCQALREVGVMNALLTVAAKRLSRIDLAVDIETDIMPSEIARNGLSKRFKALSQINSASGETIYVGSRKSQRYARIYRYHSPHPRNHLLRLEFVYRKQYAKDFAAAFIASHFDYQGAMALCGEAYGIKHDCWQPGQSAIDIDLTPPNKGKAGTIRWLITSVAPAFRQLVKDQIITEPETFLQEHFLS